jgi:uncharacterized protein (TIGR03663 family)
VLIVLLALFVLLVRSQDLNKRVMHHDEANQAVRAGQLLDGGGYAYDPHEHHGPTLYYFTLPIAVLRGQKSLADTDEATYRFLPVAFSALTLLLTLWLLRDMGVLACVWAVVFGTLSPGLFFYSRFYIQESLLVCFTFGLIVAGRRYWRTRRMRWAIWAGVFLGLMHATKETCILAWAAMGLAVLCQLRTPARLKKVWGRLEKRHLAWFAGVAATVSIVLFSSFFTHWRGPLDSILTYTTYLGRSGDARHAHPSFWYYSKLMFAHKDGGLVFRPELAIGILALVGAVAAFLRRDRRSGFARFLVLYVFFLTVVYSALSYKTPWCILSSLHGMTLLAGLGVDAVWRLLGKRWWSGILACLVGIGGAWVTLPQMVRINAQFQWDERNPYVYVHTSSNLLKLVRRVADIADVSKEGRGLFIAVVTSPENAWPLPWYLRRYPSVGYWTDPSQLPAQPAEPALVIATPDFDEALDRRLGDGYLTEYYGLRPRQDVLLSLHIRRDLWDRFMQTRTTKPPR